jgi:hypothetical protein
LVADAIAGSDGVSGSLDDGQSLGRGSVHNGSLLGFLAVSLLNGGSESRSLCGLSVIEHVEGEGLNSRGRQRQCEHQ